MNTSRRPVVLLLLVLAGLWAGVAAAAPAGPDVRAGRATRLAIGAPTSVAAGAVFAVTVTALDDQGNVDAGYAGVVHCTSSDGLATLPTAVPLARGVGVFSAILRTWGGQTLSATGVEGSVRAGTSAPIAVTATAATHFRIEASPSAVAGAEASFTVTALDAFHNVSTGYDGLVHFTSSDGAATLPAEARLSNGVGGFRATLRTAGRQVLGGHDAGNPAIAGASAPVAVRAAAAARFRVEPSASSTSAGAPVAVAVTALDAFDNIVADHARPVRLLSSDGAGTLPGDAMLTGGVGTFHVTLKTAGSHTLTVRDVADAALAGASGAIDVKAASASRLAVTAPAFATAGDPFAVTVVALDPFGNTDTAYRGSVQLTSSDRWAVLPPLVTLADGVGTLDVTLRTAEGQTVTGGDLDDAAIAGTSGPVAVSPAAATHFRLDVPDEPAPGVPFSLTVTALDPYDNVATGYGGFVTFTSTDARAVLPERSTLKYGVGGFTVTFKTGGSQVILVADHADRGIAGTRDFSTPEAAPTLGTFALALLAMLLAGAALRTMRARRLG